MNKKRIYIALFLIVFVSFKLFADDPPEWGDPPDPAPIPIAGIWYFVMAALGLGAKKLNDVRKKK